MKELPRNHKSQGPNSQLMASWGLTGECLSNDNNKKPRTNEEPWKWIWGRRSSDWARRAETPSCEVGMSCATAKRDGPSQHSQLLTEASSTTWFAAANPGHPQLSPSHHQRVPLSRPLGCHARSTSGRLRPRCGWCHGEEPCLDDAMQRVWLGTITVRCCCWNLNPSHQ